MNIGTLPARHGHYRAEHPALVTGGSRATFRDFDRRTARLAAAFEAAGVVKGGVIATALPNGAALYEAFWAAARLGAATVPLSPLLRADAVETFAADVAATLLLTHAAQAEALIAGVPIGAAPSIPIIEPGDAFNIMYSSGTTGTPKGIVLSYGVRAAYCTLFASQWRMTPESVVLHAGSRVFNGAFLTMMPAMLLGATFVLLEQFDAERVLQTIERERVTHAMMVPSQLVALLNAPGLGPARLASLQMLGSVGAPLHREHRDRLIALLPGRLYEIYGLTERFVTVLDSREFAARRDSVGVPPPFFELRILDRDGAEVAPGVIGFVDADGFLHLVDRQRELIVSGGVNVYPRDTEEVIVMHADVLEAAVFGVPHDKWGESPLAAVRLRAGAAVTAEELTRWINERVAARYQRVSGGVLCLDEFPRSTAGKTLKRVLREPYWTARGAAI